jgi:hypothetical protein
MSKPLKSISGFEMSHAVAWTYKTSNLGSVNSDLIFQVTYLTINLLQCQQCEDFMVD